MSSNYLHIFQVVALLFFSQLAIVKAQRHTKVETLIASTVATVIGSESEQCTAADCNEHGSCIGTKAVPLCICQLGFAGPRCLETYCDPMRECSARGWCVGTATQFTCFCNIGFGGERCQNEVAPNTLLTLKPTQGNSEKSKPESHNKPNREERSFEELHEHKNAELDEESENHLKEHLRSHQHQLQNQHESRHPRSVNIMQNN